MVVVPVVKKREEEVEQYRGIPLIPLLPLYEVYASALAKRLREEL